MKDPLCPKVSLAGEVDGLKPEAVTDAPKEPRVFLVSRTADAQEVLSMQDVSELERLVSVCPDAFKNVSDASSQPSDLGDATQHTYFIRRRSGLPGDCFAFGDTFLDRSWQRRDRPATLCMALLDLRQTKAPTATRLQPAPMSGRDRGTGGVSTPASLPMDQLVRPRTLLSVSLVERMPLSQEGYTQLNADFKAWSDFRDARVRMMDRFAVADNRSAEELAQEESIKKRIKKAYKEAKTAATKKRLMEQEQAGQLLGSAGENPLVEEEEEDEADESEGEADEDPEEREIRAAFDSFAEESIRRSIVETLHTDQQGEGRIPYHALRPALIQLMNRNITADVIHEALAIAGHQNPKSVHLSMDDFRHVYQW